MTAYPFNKDLRARITTNLQQFERRRATSSGLQHAAVAVALVPDATDSCCVILTRRSVELKRHAGQYALPGGRCDAGESSEAAALRELLEEVGLELDASRVLGRLDDYATRSGFVITPVVVWGTTAGLRPEPGEVAEIYRVPVAQLDGPGVPTITTIPESDRPVISIPLVGTFIHAPTAAILFQLREVGLHGRSTRVEHFEQPVFAWK